MNTHGPASGGALAVDPIFSACAYNASAMRPFDFPKRACNASNRTLSFFRFFQTFATRFFLKKQTSRYRPACQFLTQSAELIHIDIQHVSDFFQQLKRWIIPKIKTQPLVATMVNIFNIPLLISLLLIQNDFYSWLIVLQHKWRDQQL